MDGRAQHGAAVAEFVDEPGAAEPGSGALGPVEHELLQCPSRLGVLHRQDGLLVVRRQAGQGGQPLGDRARERGRVSSTSTAVALTQPLPACRVTESTIMSRWSRQSVSAVSRIFERPGCRESTPGSSAYCRMISSPP